MVLKSHGRKEILLLWSFTAMNVDKENLKEECTVIVKEGNLPHSKWSLGRVFKVISHSHKKVQNLEN